MKTTFAAASVLALASFAAAQNATVVACNSLWDACVTAPEANHAYCASQYAECLGYNPFDNQAELSSLMAETATASTTSYSNATVTGSPVYSNGTVYTTTVVTAFTTVCPSATVISTNGQVYTATAGQTLIITDCPCTLTSAVASTGAAGATKTAAAGTTTAAGSASGSSSTPAAFTGAANKAGVAGAAGLFAFAALAL